MQSLPQYTPTYHDSQGQPITAGDRVICHHRPVIGIILAEDDPLIWSGTAAFDFRPDPEQADVTAHVVACKAREAKSNASRPRPIWHDEPTRVPVFYIFPDRPRAFMETADGLTKINDAQPQEDTTS